MNNGSLLYLDVALEKLLPHLSAIFAFSLVSPKHHLNSPFSKAHLRYSAASKQQAQKKKKVTDVFIALDYFGKCPI